MASTGKRYQSHAATIRRWAGEDAKKAASPTRNRDYSVKKISAANQEFFKKGENSLASGIKKCKRGK